MNNPEGAYVIAAGGTGGHIFPGIALAREIRSRRPAVPIVFTGTGRGLERRLVPEAGFELELVRASGFAGKGAVGRLSALARLPLGILDSWRLLARRRARAVAGLGAYVSVPVLLAARLRKIPTLIHESNAIPGAANRRLNRFATRTAVGLAATNSRLARPGAVTGTPVRDEFFSVPPLDPGAATRRLLLFGGSQGSVVLNGAMLEALPHLLRERVEIVAQTGEKHLWAVRGALAGGATSPAGLRLEPFLPRLYEELAWADLVVCRAGALTLAELAAAGRPAILVPFGSAVEAHQLENARAAASAGAAVVIEEKDLSGEAIARAVSELLSDRARLVLMAERARALAQPEAAARLADLLFEAEGSSRRKP